jgi:hypothetical protein
MLFKDVPQQQHDHSLTDWTQRGKRFRQDRLTLAKKQAGKLGIFCLDRHKGSFWFKV